MAEPVQEEILEFYRSGHHADAFVMQLDLEERRLRRHQEMALLRLKTATGKNRVPLFACGTYQPLKGKLHGAEPVAELGCSYSEAILRLKEMKSPEEAGAAGAQPLIAYFSARLAGALVKLEGRGDFGSLRPIYVSPLPGSEAGELPAGLCRVVEGACAKAGAGFLYRPVVFRGADVPKAAQTGEKREPDVQVNSLMPLRDATLRNRMVLLVDDVVSSGSTLRAAGELVNLYNESFARGMALAKTAATVRDQSGAEIL